MQTTPTRRSEATAHQIGGHGRLRQPLAVLTAALMAITLTALAPAAIAAGCPDPSNTDCPTPPRKASSST